MAVVPAAVVTVALVAVVVAAVPAASFEVLPVEQAGRLGVAVPVPWSVLD